MNPVIVGKHDDDIILLDGANRFGSLKNIGCKLILAQVLDYKKRSLVLEKWNHLVYDFKLEKLKKFCKAGGLKYSAVKYKAGQEILREQFHYILASDISRDENILIQLPAELDKLLEQIDNITKLYFKHFNFDRSECDIDFHDLKKYTRRNGVLIEFPDFTKSHIVKIANNNHRLPAGISKHRINNRVLHVKYEIKKLRSDRNISAKKEELKQMLIEKIDKNKVRQYQESVIVFDE